MVDGSVVTALDDSLGRFILSAISHDLRTPLAMIKAAATSLLCDDVTRDHQATRAFANTINDEADRLAWLLTNLLDIRRIETGALTALLAPVVLEEVVDDAVKSLGAPRSSVKIRITDALPPVVADRGLLERAIANVIANAIAWSPPEAAVHVAAAVTGDHVMLRVSDHGPGIRAEHREQVFLPFRRIAGANGGSQQGVGLGLAVARGLTHAFGGELTIDDTPAAGATFLFLLPTTRRAARRGDPSAW